MVLTLDGNSEHVAQAGKKPGLSVAKHTVETAFDLIKCLEKIC